VFVNRPVSALGAFFQASSFSSVCWVTELKQKGTWLCLGGEGLVPSNSCTRHQGFAPAHLKLFPVISLRLRQAVVWTLQAAGICAMRLIDSYLSLIFLYGHHGRVARGHWRRVLAAFGFDTSSQRLLLAAWSFFSRKARRPPATFQHPPPTLHPATQAPQPLPEPRGWPPQSF